MTFDRRVGQTFKMAAILQLKRINYHLNERAEWGHYSEEFWLWII